MSKETRKNKVLKMISESTEPISASTIAKELNVSRQIIVGDVALLRAEGNDILATFRGYRLEHPETSFYAKIACVHDYEMMETELQTIIDEGATVEDVIIEHPIYGELKGNLKLKSRRDIINFMQKCEENPNMLLSHLTGGVHLHTICVDSEEMLERVKKALDEKGLLFSEE